jgi:hypothetical protein
MTMLEGLGKQPKRYLSAYVSKEALDKIDGIRGDIPRSKVIDKALQVFLDKETTAPAAAGGNNNNGNAGTGDRDNRRR